MARLIESFLLALGLGGFFLGMTVVSAAEAPRKPGFNFEMAEQGAFWICYGGAKIALVMRDTQVIHIDLIEFKAPASGRNYEQPAALHNPTVRAVFPRYGTL